MTVIAEPRQAGPFKTPSPQPGVARQAINEMIDAGLPDDLMDRVDRDGLALTGPGGVLPALVKAVLEQGLRAELTGHLGYEKGDPAGRDGGDSPNGTTPQTIATGVGDGALRVPRDRAGSVQPRLVPKGSRRAGGLDQVIISRYPGGMTARGIPHPRHPTPAASHTRGIPHHRGARWASSCPTTRSGTITDAVAEEVTAWQSRPLAERYPIVCLDALVVTVRDGHQVRDRAAHIAVGVDLDGVKHVRGIWAQASQDAKF